MLGVPAEDDQRHGPRRLGTVTRFYALHLSETNGYLRAPRNRRSKVTRYFPMAAILFADRVREI